MNESAGVPKEEKNTAKGSLQQQQNRDEEK
jgi:hypothetical protein